MNNDLEKKVEQLKTININELYQKGKYCDAMDETKLWCVAEIIEKDGDKIKIHFEGWSNKHDEVINLNSYQRNKVAPFRKYSKNYTGQKKTAFRHYNINQKDIEEIKQLINFYKTNLNQLDDPYQITQDLRGKIYFFIDMFMTANLNNSIAEKLSALINDVLYDFIDLFIAFLNFYKENANLTEIIIKNPDLFLVDTKIALMSALSEMVNTSRRIFGVEPRLNEFYRNNDSFLRKLKPRAENKYCNENNYKPNTVKDYFSVICVANFIDYLIEKEGYKAIMDMLNQLKDNSSEYLIPTVLIIPFITIIADIEIYIKSSKMTNLDTPGFILNSAKLRIENISEFEIKEIKKFSINQLASLVKSLLSPRDKKLACLCYEEILIKFYIKNSISKLLPKRLFGITSISNIIEVLDRKEKKEFSQNQAKTEEDFLFEATPTDLLISYLSQGNIIDIILTDGIHEEVIKKSIPIFKFFLSKNAIKESFYDLLWKNYTDKHESISIQMENLICEISSYISPKEKMYLFNKILELFNFYNSKIDSHNSQILFKYIDLIKKYTIGCLKSEKEIDQIDSNAYGIPFLWDFLTKHTTDKNIILYTIDALISIFDSNIAAIDDSYKEKYFKISIMNIKLNISIYPSLLFSQRLFSIIISLKNVRAITRIIKSTSEAFDLAQIFISSLIDYYSLSCTMIFDSITHKDYLEAYLNTINYFFTDRNNVTTKFYYKFDLIEEIWKLLTSNKEDKLILYNFLQISMNCNDGVSFVNNISEPLLKNILCDQSKFNISDASFCSLSFNLFKKIFLEVNFTKERLYKESLRYRVAHKDLIGFETLLDILCQAVDNKVQNSSADLIVKMTVDLYTFTEEFSRKYWNSILSNIMNKFNDCIFNKNNQGIRGILIYIQQLFNECDCEGEIPVSDDVDFASDGIDVSFTYAAQNHSRFSKISSKDRVHEVRMRMAYFYDIPFYRCALVSKTSKKIIDANDDFKLARDLISSSDSFDIINKASPLSKLKYNPKDILLSQPGLFNSLYELLSNSTSIYISNCYDLIQIFPQSKAFELEIQTCKSLDKMLTSSSEYQLNYNLTSIKNYIISNCQSTITPLDRKNSSNKSLPSITMDNQWIDLFLEKSGVEYLIENIKKVNIGSSLSYSIITNILVIIKTAYQKYKKIDNLFNKWTKKDIIYSLLDVFNTIIDQSIKSEELHKIEQENFIKIKEKLQQKQDSVNYITYTNKDDFCTDIYFIFNEQEEVCNNIFSFFDLINDNSTLISLIINKIDLFEQIIIKSYISSINYKIKDSLYYFINKLLQGSEELKIFVLKLLLNQLTNTSIRHQYAYKFLITLSDLIYNNFSDKIIDNSTLKNISYILNFIDDFKYEKNKNMTLTTVGYMKILKSCVFKSVQLREYIVSNKNIFDLLLKNGIFSKCQTNPLNENFPKFNDQLALTAAYELLACLSYKNNDLINKIIDEISNYMNLGFWKGKKYTDWKIDLKQELKSTCDCVGLVNLGCTCYMNSLLQQFYNITSIRESILLTKEYKDNIKLSSADLAYSTSLSQLKNIFSALKAYESKAYNPKDFCLNFENQPLSIIEQMDVDEFFNMLLDKLEPQFVGSKYDNPFKYQFGGFSSNDIICKGCPHKSEREERFNCLILSLKSNINDALKSHAVGELLEGDNAFYCETCDKKVDAIKRTSVKYLPRTLILVLKRFEFDYDTLQKFKLNNYCEFPEELNMKEYTQEYLDNKDCSEPQEMNKPDNHYIYDLSGVIIHMGTADSGHYISLVKQENSEVWLEYNDCKVKTYDIENLKNDAFGGSDTFITKEGKTEMVDKQSNAYVLFYTRKVNNTIEIKKNQDKVVENEHIEQIIQEYNTYQNENHPQILKKIQNLSETQLDKVNYDNFLFWIMKTIFNQEYINFTIDLVSNYNLSYYLSTTETKNTSSYTVPFIISNNPILCLNQNHNSSQMLLRDPKSIRNTNIDEINAVLDYDITIDLSEQEEKIFKFAILTYFNIVLRSLPKNNNYLYVDIIKALLNKNERNSMYLLEEFSHIDVLTEYLVDCPIAETRLNTCSIIYCAILKLNDSYCSSNANNNTEIYKIFLFKFVNSLIDNISKLMNKDISHIYYLLWRFSQLNGNGDDRYYAKLYLIEIKFYEYLTDIYYTKYCKMLNNSQENTMINGNISLSDITANFEFGVKHKILSTKVTNKIDKLTAFEESQERKVIEKINYSKNDTYLYMTFIELLISTHNSKDDKVLNNTLYHNMLLAELKSKQSALLLSRYFNQLCFNNSQNSLCLSEAFKIYFNDKDYNEIEYQLRAFKMYLLINDNIKSKRIKESIQMITDLINDNMKYYKFTEQMIEWVIKLFSTRKSFLSYHDNFKALLVKLIKWVKDNPVPPQYVASKTITMFKKRNFNISGNTSQTVISNFNSKNQIISQERQNRLSDIYRSKY